MNHERYRAVLAALTTVVTLLLGVVGGMSDEDHRRLLQIHTERTGEYVDYAVARRLESIAPEDPEFLLAKELVLSQGTAEINKLIDRIARRGWSATGLIISIIFLQSCIASIAGCNEKSSRRITPLQLLLLFVAVFLAVASLLWLLAL